MMSPLRLFLRRTLRVLLVCLGGLTSFVLILNLVENWRGTRAWAEWKGRHEASGVNYDWSKAVPPNVLDSENFGRARIVENALKGEQPILKGLKYQTNPPNNPGWEAGNFEGLDTWEKAFGTKDLEGFLSTWEGPLSEFSEACRLPKCRLWQDYPPPGGAAVDGYIVGFRQMARMYRIRSLERLRAGRDQEALEDIRTILRLSAHLEREPGIMPFLLESAVLPQAFQPVWEGLVRHRWQASQLSVLQDELGRVDLVGFMRRSLDGERVWEVLSMERTLQEKPLHPWWLIFPKGWVRQNMVRADRFFIEEWIPILDPANHHVDLAAYRGLIAKAGTHRLSTPYTCLWPMQMPALIGLTRRMAYNQSALDEAAVVCALERYRLEHRAYPESLEDLVPGYLERPPKDLITGKPIHYAQAGNGSFDLYGVGWDGQDHGGTVVLGEGARPEMEYSDWVWPKVGLDGQIRRPKTGGGR